MVRKKIPKKIKEEVKVRAHGCCEYCQVLSSFCPSPFPNDHIDPRSKGGSDKPSNLAFICNGCNWLKSDKTEGLDPKTGQLVPLFHPRKHDWIKHFKWTEGNLMVVGLTPIGRATIEALQLNREGVVNLRFALSIIGKHPPSHTLNKNKT